MREDLAGRSLVEVIRDDARAAAARGADARRRSTAARATPASATGRSCPSRARPRATRSPGRRSARDRVGAAVVDRYRLHHGGGLVIPLVHVRRDGGAARASCGLRLGLDGKIGPADWPEVEARLEEGHEVRVVRPARAGRDAHALQGGLDRRPRARSADEEAAYASPLSGVLANHVYNAQLLGRPYLLEVIEDVEIAVRFARARLGAREVAIDAPGDARLLARAAVAALPELELGLAPDAGPGFSWAEAVDDAARDLADPLPRAGGRDAAARVTAFDLTPLGGCSLMVWLVPARLPGVLRLKGPE